MNTTEIHVIDCAYCGEQIEIVIDCSVESQEYIEDCHVCCKPITVTVEINANDSITVNTRGENDC